MFQHIGQASFKSVGKIVDLLVRKRGMAREVHMARKPDSLGDRAFPNAMPPAPPLRGQMQREVPQLHLDTAPIKGSDQFLPHISSLVDKECVQVIGVFDSGRWSMQS